MKKNHKNATCAQAGRWKTFKLKILMIVFLLAGAANLFAQSQSAKKGLSLNVKNTSVAEVITALKKQVKQHFIYNVEELKDLPPISINVKNKSLEEILEQLKKENNLNYSIQNNTVIISRRKDEKPSNANEFYKDIRIEGKVVDKDNRPLRGVTITELATGRSTATNSNGMFHLNVKNNARLQFSFVGMETKSVYIDNQKNLNVVLLPKSESLNEIVVNAGYYKTTQAESTGSISSIDSKTIEKQPVTNVLNALAGRMPGVQILQQSGTAGSGISIQIRAANSLYAGSTPLYIVDGVPFLGDAIYKAGGNTSAGIAPAAGSNPLNLLNPNDIDNISILKDADATSIYGSRGANGVVLITTKRQKGGKAKIDFGFTQGISRVASLHRVKTLSLPQYLEIRRQAYKNSGVTPTPNTAPDLLVWDQNKTSDWEDLFFGETSNSSDANLSLSAGNRNLSFLLSGTYHTEDGVIPGDFNYQRGGLRMAAGYTSDDDKFGINVTTTFNSDKNQGNARSSSTADLANVAYSAPSNYPLYNPDGSLYWFSGNASLFSNPFAYQHKKYTGNSNVLIGSVGMRFSPIKGLNLKLDASYNRIFSSATDLSYLKSINPFTTTKPSGMYQQNYNETWNVEPMAEYIRKVSQGVLSVQVGSAFQSSTYVQPYYIAAGNFASDKQLRNFTSGSMTTLNSFDSQYKYSSLFARVNYNWLKKYIVNVNYRLDASSKFGINKRSGSFGSVGAAWILSEEKFVKSLQPVISFAKLRSSYGSSGNDQINNYQFSDNYSTSFAPYDNIPGLNPQNLANPNLAWEVNKKFEIAFDLGLFDDRINLSTAWFNNKTNNPLVTSPLSTLTGFPSYVANIDATIETYGMEFSLNTKNISTKNFKWDSYFNISNPKSKLAAFRDIENSNYVRDKLVGGSLANIYGFRYLGIEASTSLPMVADENKDGRISNPNDNPTLAAYGKGDYIKIGNSDADFYGGLGNNFTYKGFELDIFAQFVGRKMVRDIANAAYNGRNAVGATAANMVASYYDLYQQTGGKLATTGGFSINDINSPASRYLLYANSDATISNAAFIRLKNVALSYNLPEKWIKPLNLSRGTIFVNGQNLFVITNFEGYDPETQPNNVPPMKTFVLGFRATF
ncbi:SusC/RagA family TonB-linked outer membrane protein [Pedobacter nyackensis]|uniref:SusC/RagA family TonB-linked outer membrane protein n=1 Tax=Pedobacter nyackensis TaxID=475255 RepID=UPI002931F07A|nr:SusC/RagA family TonB-linked outer membrane protein [Pedobacter nyackensis]